MDSWMYKASMNLQQLIAAENGASLEPDNNTLHIPRNHNMGQFQRWSDEHYETVVQLCKKVYRFLDETLLTLLGSGATSFVVGQVRYFENGTMGNEERPHPGNVTSIDLNMELDVFNLSPRGRGSENAHNFFLHLLQSNSAQLDISAQRADSFRIMEEDISIVIILTNGAVVGLRLCSVEIPKGLKTIVESQRNLEGMIHSSVAMGSTKP